MNDLTPSQKVAFSRKRRGLAYAIVGIDLGLYVSALWGVHAAPHWALALACSVMAGIMIGLLFIVGHDCCHGSFLPTRWENTLVGQLVFLPSLHPYSLWELGHNKLHHRFTNLRPKDYVYRPLSKCEYDALSPFQRGMYRFHRSCAGVLTYYLWEIWWKRMFVPTSGEIGALTQRHKRDLVIVHTFLVGCVCLCFLLGGDAGGIVKLIVLGLVLPFAVWNTLMSFLIYLHHTHPDVVWWDRKEDWSFRKAQLRSTIHVRFPGWINGALHWIMEHPAHHLRPGIPLYHLREAEKAIEAAVEDPPIEFRWSLREHIKIAQICRLYDYDKRQWLDYDGSPSMGQG